MLHYQHGRRQGSGQLGYELREGGHAARRGTNNDEVGRNSHEVIKKKAPCALGSTQQARKQLAGVPVKFVGNLLNLAE